MKEKIKKILKRVLFGIIIIAFIIALAFGMHTAYKYYNGVNLTQLSPQTKSQMMGYIIKTKTGKVIVVDGGTPGDGENLRKYIRKYGNKVDAWFLTHPHRDHVGAFIDTVNKDSDIKIKKIYKSMDTIDEIEKYQSERENDAKDLFTAFDNTNVKDNIEEVTLGENIQIDNVSVEVLGVKNPEITNNYGNNSSMVLKVHVNNKSILFLGDTGLESGNKLISMYPKEKLKSDIVQMAHHGQAGASEKLYEVIDPKIALWPTPEWLWDDDTGEGTGSGNWKTLDTRAWMDNIGVKKNYVAKDGDITIRVW